MSHVTPLFSLHLPLSNCSGHICGTSQTTNTTNKRKRTTSLRPTPATQHDPGQARHCHRTPRTPARIMKLSVFLVLLPSVSAFVVNPATLLKQPHHHRDAFLTAAAPAASAGARTAVSSSSSRMSMGAQPPVGEEGAWSLSAWWRDVIGSASGSKAKVDSTAADAYAELKKKVLVKKERQSLEGQLTSLIRIEGNTMSCKAGDLVRRLASELEALQDNADEFGSQKTGLAGSWKLIYSSACCGDGKQSRGGGGSTDRLTSIEDISYVSENYRLSHSDDGVLRVYRRVSPRPVRQAAAAAAAGDDTSAGLVGSGSGKSKSAGRGTAAAARELRAGARQPLLRKRFWGFLRR
ncbi:unnamed protein product [Scytosiphon promiscuus]